MQDEWVAALVKKCQLPPQTAPHYPSICDLASHLLPKEPVAAQRRTPSSAGSRPRRRPIQIADVWLSLMQMGAGRSLPLGQYAAGGWAEWKFPAVVCTRPRLSHHSCSWHGARRRRTALSMTGRWASQRSVRTICAEETGDGKDSTVCTEVRGTEIHVSVT